MTAAPALYVGTVRHRRFAPTAHQFRYALFMALLDVDHLPDAMRVSRLTSYNRWNWATYDERDHLGDPRLPLRERLRASAAAAGEALPDGPIHLLTHLRYAGYVFNPISFFYCYDRDAVLRLVLAEVNNTYRGSRAYWLRPACSAEPAFRAVAAKSLYVSPFMDYDVDYHFALTPPAATLVAHMTVVAPAPAADARPLFDATLTLARRPWDRSAIRATLLRFPWMTATVIAAIHWEAVRLRLKRLPVKPFPDGLTGGR